MDECCNQLECDALYVPASNSHLHYVQRSYSPEPETAFRCMNIVYLVDVDLYGILYHHCPVKTDGIVPNIIDILII